MNKHTKKISGLIANAEKNIEKNTNQILKKLNCQLCRLYKGKKATLKCFDTFVDATDYVFATEILNIKAYKYEDDIVVQVTVMYKSIYAEKEDKPEPSTFYLEEIVRVF